MSSSKIAIENYLSMPITLWLHIPGVWSVQFLLYYQVCFWAPAKCCQNLPGVFCNIVKRHKTKMDLKIEPQETAFYIKLRLPDNGVIVINGYF